MKEKKEGDEAVIASEAGAKPLTSSPGSEGHEKVTVLKKMPFCPLFSMRDRGFRDYRGFMECIGSLCALYTGKGCAIKEIGEGLEKLSKELERIRKAKEVEH